MISGPVCRQDHILLVAAAQKLILRNCCPQFGFKRNELRTAVDAVLAYLERCRISEGAGATQPLALEVHLRLSVAVSFEPFCSALTPARDCCPTLQTVHAGRHTVAMQL